MWKEENGKLVKEYTFRDFNEAIAFINQVAIICEEQNHHPEIRNEYNRLTLSFCTHDAGHIITEKDREITRLIDKLSHD